MRITALLLEEIADKGAGEGGVWDRIRAHGVGTIALTGMERAEVLAEADHQMHWTDAPTSVKRLWRRVWQAVSAPETAAPDGKQRRWWYGSERRDEALPPWDIPHGDEFHIVYSESRQARDAWVAADPGIRLAASASDVRHLTRCQPDSTMEEIR
jgi:hypothetical protein